MGRAALRPAVPALVDDVIAAVGAAVPEYEGQLDANVRRGVQQGLEGFLQLVAGGDAARLPGREVYVAFGRGEWRAGRSLEALLAAYRAGAQVAWRELSAAGEDPWWTYAFATMFASIRQQRWAAVSDDVAALTGRAPAPVESML